MVHTREQAFRALGGGAAAGIVAGALMSLYHVAIALAAGRDAWPVVKGAGAPFLGSRAFAPGFDGVAVATGLASHFAVSVAWGAAFGLLFFGLTKGRTIFAGLAWGVVVWLGMYHVVLPLVGLGAMASSVPIQQAVIDHLLFGLVLAIAFLPFQVSLPRRLTAL